MFKKQSLWRLILACSAGCGASGVQNADTLQSVQSDVAGDARSEERLTGPLTIQGVGFMTPECVLHDAEGDVYLVSNIQGSALERDDQAFISRILPNGSLDALKWIDSAAPGVTLHAPKGMAIAHGILYVADIDTVRKFDRKTGKPLGDVVIPGATFLNDVAVDVEGNVLVSDSGLTTGFTPSGTDALYRIDRQDNVTALVKTRELGGPNGLLAAADGLWVVTFNSGEMYKIGTDGVRREVRKLPKGSLDGIVAYPGGALVSSWEGSAIYRCDPQGTAVEVISSLNAPADIGFDTKRNRVLIPLYTEDAVVIHPL